jgi:hypothetical protein
MRNILLISLFAALLVVSGCHHIRGNSGLKGSGKREVQKRQIGAFTAIHTEGAFDIEVVCQKDLSLEVEGDDNILPLVSTEVSGGTLKLTNSKSYSVNSPITIRITTPDVGALHVSGAGKITITGLKNDKFEIDLDGAPSINVAGTTKLIDIDANGAGKVDAHNLHAARGVVESKGVCKVDVDVADQLDVTVSGPSSVTYQGNPVVNKTINGPGKVEQRTSDGA